MKTVFKAKINIKQSFAEWKRVSNNYFNLIILLSRFVPFAALSQAQNVTIASRPELQVK